MAYRDKLPFQAMEMRNPTAFKSSSTTSGKKDRSHDSDTETPAHSNGGDRLKRTFGRVSLVAFSTTLLASWESIACLLEDGLINGGPASLVYGLVFAFIGSLATCASLAEMTSMIPTSGGQYHWVAELAPIHIARPLSYAAGWITSFARLSIAASAAYVAATEIQGLLVFNVQSYVSQNWHGTMLYWMVLLTAVSVNILGIKFFPHIETMAFIHHICFFFVFLVPLVYLSPQSTATFVFATFENAGGWSSNGVSWGIGLLASAWAFVGIDGTSHMSEEVQKAARVVPESMVIAFFISGSLAFAASIAILFSIGDLHSTLSTATDYPIIQVFYTATKSRGATTAIIVGLMMTSVFSTFGLLASASRITWALARDKGFPFSTYFQYVDRQYYIPVRAIFLIAIIAMLLGLLNIWSSTAFNAMTSLSLIAQYTSYVLPISLMVRRRIEKRPLPYGPFRLGQWGILINIVSILYTVLLLVFMVLPPYQPVTAKNMNYAAVVFGALLALCAIMWAVHGRRVYTGPVKETSDNLHIH